MAEQRHITTIAAGVVALILVATDTVMVLIMAVLLTAAASCKSAGSAPSGVGVLKSSPTMPAEAIPLLQQYGQLCPEFPAPVLAAQIGAESNWTANAVSSTAARGWSQFEDATWATWGKDTTSKGYADQGNLSDAISAQAHYDCSLASQVRSYASTGVSVTALALAAYNAGPGAVMAAHGIPRNGQTEAYVPKIMESARLEYSGAAGGSTWDGPAPSEPSPTPTPLSSNGFAKGGCGQTSGTLGGGEITVRAVTYPSSDGSPQPADLYLPPDASPTSRRPVVVMVHGGGFYLGDKTDIAGEAQQFAQHGYIVLNINYHLAAPRWPREVQDVEAAIRYARLSAEAWNGDPSKIVDYGVSAGANLALMAADSPPDHSGLSATMGISGPYDLPGYLPNARSAATFVAGLAVPVQYFGADQAFAPVLQHDASPALVVGPGAPPTYLANSADELVPVSQMEGMAAALTARGVPVAMRLVPGTQHVPTAQLPEALTWLDHTLGFTPPPPPSTMLPPGIVAPSDPQQAAAVGYALAQLGKPYVWGGTGPDGFDCSGLMLRAWQTARITLPRTAAAQSRFGTPVAGVTALQPGDLIFIPGSDGTATDPGHVGMYLGGGQLVDAPQDGIPVRIDSLQRWQNQIVGIRRPGSAPHSS